MWVRSLGQEDPLEGDMATHSSIPASKIPGTEEPAGLQSIGWQELDTTELSTHKENKLNIREIRNINWYTSWKCQFNILKMYYSRRCTSKVEPSCYSGFSKNSSFSPSKCCKNVQRVTNNLRLFLYIIRCLIHCGQIASHPTKT